VCRWHATYHWKALDNSYNFAENLIVIKGLHIKLCAPKVTGVTRVPALGILRLPLRSPKTKSHLDVAPMERCKVYYKGEGDGFPQVRAMMSLVSLSRPWFILAPKVFWLCTNHLVLILYMFVWVVEACQFFLVPSWSFSTALYPFKMLWTKECAPTFYSFVISSLDSHLSPSRSWECVIFEDPQCGWLYTNGYNIILVS
jgi:hypothetical protein